MDQDSSGWRGCRQDMLTLILVVGLIGITINAMSYMLHVSQEILDLEFELSALFLCFAVTMTIKECIWRYQERKKEKGNRKL